MLIIDFTCKKKHWKAKLVTVVINMRVYVWACVGLRTCKKDKNEKMPIH